MLAELSPRGPSYLALAASLLSAIALIACGSNQGASSSGERTIPKQVFMKKVLAICAEANDEIGRVYNQYADPPYPGGQRPTSEKMNEVAEEVVIPARQKQVRRIEALGFPPGERRQVEAILDALREGIEEGERDRRTLRADGVRYAFTRALRLEGAYGLEACVTG